MTKSLLAASVALLYTSVGHAGATCKWIPQMCPGEGGGGDDPSSLPEPAMLGLLGAGLVAVGVAAYRRRRKRD